uniref:Uncharacterized protein n=1 Tax=Romanomermis culicivorax TaxID=13658 RepID=A0A915I0Z5_ROMCU
MSRRRTLYLGDRIPQISQSIEYMSGLAADFLFNKNKHTKNDQKHRRTDPLCASPCKSALKQIASTLANLHNLKIDYVHPQHWVPYTAIPPLRPQSSIAHHLIHIFCIE